MRLQSLSQSGRADKLNLKVSLNPVNPQDPIKPIAADNNLAISLRPAQAADDPFLLELYASTRAHEMALVPWTEEQKAAFVRMQFEGQKTHYAAQYPRAGHEIIDQHETPAGRLYLDRGSEVLHILDITIHPARRNAGIGSYVLAALLGEARQSNKRVTIYVESFNPSLRLFERLGFRKAEEHGFHFLMEWKA
jgi:ribosomal protein S18 acetylase RimI-like enzyme